MHAATRGILGIAVIGAFAGAALACAPPAEALIGGTPVAVGERPYYARVMSSVGECGGAVVSSEWVITARHCVAKGDASAVVITAGWTAAGEGRPVTLNGIEAVWNPTIDLALIRIPKTPGLASIAPAATLPKAGDTYLNVSAGEGSGDRVTQSRFRLDWASPYYEFTAKSVSGTSANCYGDSGSPDIVETPDGDRLIGVSWGITPTDCSLGSRTRSNNVTYAATREWMTATMGTAG